MDRSKEIVKVSYKGIAVNLLLVVFKAIAGFLANSTAVILDAVNNLSDMLSSVITIIGTKLANRDPDKEHPYGHGRIEYITSAIIAVIVLLAGLASLRESIGKILHPAETNYSALTITVIVAGIAAKFLLGGYYLKKGTELNSGSLTASGTDARGDAIISIATLIAAIINLVLSLNLEGWLGAVISLFILKAGYEIISDTLSSIIGVRADEELIKKVKHRVSGYDGIYGAYDLIIHSYGPEKYFGSIHVEVDDDMTVREMDALTRQITADVYSELGVLLTIGVYATNTSNEISRGIKNKIRAQLDKYPQIIQMHGFYVDEDKKLVTFDIIIDFKEKEAEQLTETIRQELMKQLEGYSVYINLDRDYSD